MFRKAPEPSPSAAPPSDPGIVWEGADDLRGALRPVDELKTHPANPRVGDIAEIQKSLARFGQVRPVLVDPSGTIVAGNHTYLAAVDLGWTHVAAVGNDFKDEAEARAYLLADNRLADLGEYERAELIAMLAEIEAVSRWDGTGYTEDDLATLRALDEAVALPHPSPPPAVPPLPPGPETREVVLLLDDEKFEEMSRCIRVLRERYGLEGVTETVCRAIRDEALALNQAAG